VPIGIPVPLISPPRTAAFRIADSLPDAAFVIDADGKISWANDRCVDTLGWALDDIVGADVLDFVHPDDTMLAITSLASVRENGLGTHMEIRSRSVSGEWRTIELIGRHCLDDPDIGGVLCLARDLTERRRWEVAAGDDTRIQRVLQHVPTIVALLDAGGVITSANGALTRLLGQDPSRMLGRRLVTFAADEREGSRLSEAIDATTSSVPSAVEVEMASTGPNGRIPIRFEVVDLLDDPAVAAIVITGHDISELHEARSRLEHLASHDALTDLPNRALLARCLDDLLAARRPLTLLYVDLDHFKPVNDRHGHRAGDEVLKRVADRLRLVVSTADVVARVGGDEFVVLAVGVADPRDVRDLAVRIKARVEEPYDLPFGEVRIGVSVGTAIAGPDDTADALLHEADGDMYSVKAAR
jgi:diguanylate cyclase (GGDEF)-like protein/PAS domain S-box-containing protein